MATLAVFASHAAVVYKWTDSNGLVHYSDQSVPGAEKIFTASGGRPAGADSQAGGGGSLAPAAKKPAVAGFNVAQFAITSPTPEQTFFGDEAIGVRLALDPELKPNQTITWHLNGRQLEETATQFTLPHLDRGTYAIAATLTDQQTGDSKSTGSVTFFVHQPSALSPEHKRP